jgi:hypothetical protein
LSTFLYYVWT